MHVSKRSALAVAGVAAIAFAVPALADQHSPAGGTGGTDQSVTCNDGYITWTPTNIWPPNHKFVPVTISYYDTDGDGDSTAVAVTAVTETDNGQTYDATVGQTIRGAGQPGAQQGPDAQPDTAGATPGSDPNTAATFVEDVRAERSGLDGHGSGRTYTLTVQCTDSGSTSDPSEMSPETGTANITVTVPHDQGVVKQ